MVGRYSLLNSAATVKQEGNDIFSGDDAPSSVVTILNQVKPGMVVFTSLKMDCRLIVSGNKLQAVQDIKATGNAGILGLPAPCTLTGSTEFK